MATKRTGEVERFDNGSFYTKTITIVTCCGEDVECDGKANSCPHCGVSYNQSGSKTSTK